MISSIRSLEYTTIISLLHLIKASVFIHGHADQLESEILLLDEEKGKNRTEYYF